MDQANIPHWLSTDKSFNGMDQEDILESGLGKTLKSPIPAATIDHDSEEKTSKFIHSKLMF